MDFKLKGEVEMLQQQPKMTVITKYLLLLLLLVGMNAYTASSQSTVDTLPGYNGTLPFKLETGYIGVGENGDEQMFYYFYQSENDPTTDPLILFISGGGACAALRSIFYEIGPLAFDIANFDGSSLPSLTLNPYSWTKVANIIFLDSPGGTGFSYSDSSQGYYASSDSQSVFDIYTFLRKWFSIYPAFLKNHLYIAGESYGGKMTLWVASEIVKGNEAGLQPIMSLKGYIIGNSGLELEEMNNRVPYAHRMGLISDQQYQLARNSCNGEYANPNPNNSQCLHALEIIKECIDPINDRHILEPKCSSTSVDYPDNLLTISNTWKVTCRLDTYVIVYNWANVESVRDALHIRKGTVTEWTLCNERIIYKKDIDDVVGYHKFLAKRGFPALIYNGDHDMVACYMGTLKLIHQLNITPNELWRPWIVNGQVAGYTEKYKHNQGQEYITFATVKGAGHTAPEYKPKECFAMIQRWLSLYPL